MVIGVCGEVYLFVFRYVSLFIFFFVYFLFGIDFLWEEYLEVFVRVLRGDYFFWWYCDDENGDVDEDGEWEDDIFDDEGLSDEDEWLF